MPIHIYTDGCCLGNPGPGGYAAIIVNADGTHREFTASEATDDKQQDGADGCPHRAGYFRPTVRIARDLRQPVPDPRMNDYLPRWKKNGWRTAKRKPVKNQDLWIRLEAMDLGHDIQWVWVRGHNGDRFNELADRLANEAARNAQGAA
jgi:ribonuclease HI